jgi:hypothetical protein
VKKIYEQSNHQVPLCDSHYLIPEEKDTEFTQIKAGLIVHMMGQRLGRENLQKVGKIAFF